MDGLVCDGHPMYRTKSPIVVVVSFGGGAFTIIYIYIYIYIYIPVTESDIHTLSDHIYKTFVWILDSLKKEGERDIFFIEYSRT